MREAIDKYLEDVLCYADLAAPDERNVRAELTEHLNALVDSSGLSNPKEVYAMLTDQFGSPKRVGRGIAAAKGRMRTYFKKTAHKLPLRCAVALVLAFAVRYSVAQAFYVTGDGVAPIIPRGNRVLVYKLARDFNAGDVIVYRNTAGEYLMGTIQGHSATGGWMVARNARTAREVHDISRPNIVGRVFLNTR